MTLGDRILERVARATLEEIARAEFVDLDLDDGEMGPNDAERVAGGVERAVARKNQFAGDDPELAASLRRVLAAMFDSIARGEPRAQAAERAKGELRDAFRKALGDPPREVTSATYSPELQLSVLGLSVAELAEPILDVGCGEDARLVRFLRNAGKDARGLDRQAPPDLGDSGDWLTFDYGNARWGTLVSHLGFSLHFMHQEMRSSDRAFDYARTYMRMLKALRPGGTFAYVPGLPFIEAMLPAKELRVTRVPLARELVTDAVERVQEATGLVLDAASHVTRLR